MSVSLHEIFESFCDATNGRLRWKDRRKTWTAFVVDFFDEYMRSKGFSESQKNIMTIDAIWRDESLGYIVLALEHENEGDVQDFLKEEIRHLLDLKSIYKLAITYPHTGETKEAVQAICDMVQRGAIMESSVFGEHYLIVFGFSTWVQGKRAIQWKGYFISSKGQIEERERIVLQKS